MQKLISIVTPCFNEEENVLEVYRQVKNVFNELKDYRYEHIFIDNSSTDKTLQILKEIAQNDFNVKIIVNSRNFGIVNGYYAMLQSTGDAVIQLVADLQEPPYLIKDLLKKWEEGYKIVLAVKNKSEESKIMYAVRTFYYNTFNKLSDIQIINHFSGFGLCDRLIIDILRKIDDPSADLRGLLGEIGFEKAIINFTQPIRHRGVSKNNLYKLYDHAMLCITGYSKIPLRISTFIGFLIATLSLLVALGYFIYKLFFWNSFQLGIAPLIIGIFFFGGVQLLFLGIIGEYIGAIFTQVKKHPLVIEKERINFD